VGDRRGAPRRPLPRCPSDGRLDAAVALTPPAHAAGSEGRPDGVRGCVKKVICIIVGLVPPARMVVPCPR
jgi:hypothetical protein